MDGGGGGRGGGASFNNNIVDFTCTHTAVCNTRYSVLCMHGLRSLSFAHAQYYYIMTSLLTCEPS